MLAIETHQPNRRFGVLQASPNTKQSGCHLSRKKQSANAWVFASPRLRLVAVLVFVDWRCL